MPRIANMCLKENKDGERSCFWDMRQTKKWGGWSRKRRKEEEERQRGEKDRGLLQACGRWWVLGRMFKGQIYVSSFLLGPYIWCWLWNVPGSRLWIRHTWECVKDFWDRTGRGLLWETGQQQQAAEAKMGAGPLFQTIWKTPSREVEGFPKTLQTEFHTIFTTEGMKPELIWFSQ